MDDRLPSLSAGEWLVLADGARLLAFQVMEVEEREGPVLRLQLRVSDEHLAGPARDFASDRPGRLRPAVGMAISAVDQADGHEAAEAAFLRGVAEELDDLAVRRQLVSAVLVAPARAMGLLRTAMSPRLRDAIRGEIVADLVHSPVEDLESRFLVRSTPG